MTTSDQRCVLIRHGQTLWSLEGRHTGRTDVPLLPEGVEQARALRHKLSGSCFATVLTSPLLRARETCDLAGLGQVAVVVPDLAEWDYGAYEGVTTSEIRLDRPGWDLFDDGVPDGESIEDVARRVDRVIERIHAAEGDVACVAHSHVLRVLAARWIGVDPSFGRSLVLSPGSFSELGWDRERPVVVSWNRH
ncbi:MAG: histidine phosphatase family protein [Acidimicrobiales bacterium]|jgi:probable phosphoglycerate mutase